MEGGADESEPLASADQVSEDAVDSVTSAPVAPSAAAAACCGSEATPAATVATEAAPDGEPLPDGEPAKAVANLPVACAPPVRASPLSWAERARGAAAQPTLASGVGAAPTSEPVLANVAPTAGAFAPLARDPPEPKNIVDYLLLLAKEKAEGKPACMSSGAAKPHFCDSVGGAVPEEEAVDDVPVTPSPPSASSEPTAAAPPEGPAASQAAAADVDEVPLWRKRLERSLDADILVTSRSSYTKLGIRNDANNCYVNVVVQALLPCSALMWLLRGVAASEDAGRPFLSCLSRLCREFHTRKPGQGGDVLNILAMPFVKDIITRWQRLGAQQDAGEFLMYLLAGLHDECKWRLPQVGAAATVAAAEEPTSSREELVDAAAGADAAANFPALGLSAAASASGGGGDSSSAAQADDGDADAGAPAAAPAANGMAPAHAPAPAPAAFNWVHVAKTGRRPCETREAGVHHEDSPITRVFGGVYESAVRSRGAGTDSVSLEPFNRLDLDISAPEVKTLRSAFDAYCSAEVVNDGSSRRQLKFKVLPRVLVVVLKRFAYNKGKGGAQKIQKAIKYDEKLVLDGANLADGVQPREYFLTALICHHGESVHNGHYTAVVRYNAEWYMYDDTVVRRIEPREAGAQHSSAYLLIYQSRGTVSMRP